MLHILNIFFILFISSPNLLPPFYPNSRNQIGFWQVIGTTTINEDYITLTSTYDNKTGSVWSTLPIPVRDWSLTTRLRFSSQISGDGAAISFLQPYGTEGNLYGVPSTIHGLSLQIASFTDLVSNIQSFHLRLIQSNKKTKFSPMTLNDPYDFIINRSKKSNVYSDENDSETLEIKLTISNNKITVSEGNDYLFSQNLSVDISRCYIGISASSFNNHTQIDLLSSFYLTGNDFLYVSQKEKYSSSQNLSFFPNNPLQPLRSFSFKKMKDAIKEIQSASNFNYEQQKQFIPNPSTQKNISDFFEIISEFEQVLEKKETYKMLDSFISSTIGPYTEQWHKRTFTIMSMSKIIQNKLDQTILKTQALFDIINNTVIETGDKAGKKLFTLSKILDNETLELIDNNNAQIKLIQTADSGFVTLLKYISILEVIIILLIFYFYYRMLIY